MEFDRIAQLAQQQGPIFWIATTAIALGATLLVAALVQFLRGRLAARRAFSTGRPAPAPLPAEPAPAAAPDLYEPSRPPLAAPAPPAAAAPLADDDGDYSLALLLRRLQSAGDRLEEIAGDLRGENLNEAHSVLKDDLQDVEYVFRASGS